MVNIVQKFTFMFLYFGNSRDFSTKLKILCGPPKIGTLCITVFWPKQIFSRTLLSFNETECAVLCLAFRVNSSSQKCGHAFAQSDYKSAETASVRAYYHLPRVDKRNQISRSVIIAELCRCGVTLKNRTSLSRGCLLAVRAIFSWAGRHNAHLASLKWPKNVNHRMLSADWMHRNDDVASRLAKITGN